MAQQNATVFSPTTITVGEQIQWTKYGFMTTFALLVYDHILTTQEEVEYVWKWNFTAATWLFFLNRYYALFAIGIGLLEDISPAFNPKICARMILFQPIAVAIPLTAIPNFIVSLRIYAIYQRSKPLLAILLAYIVTEVAVALWIDLTPSVEPISTLPMINATVANTNTAALHTCLAQVSPRLSLFQTALFQLMQSIYNVIALGLILFKTARGKGVVGIIAKQGLVYYVANFVMVMSWTMMLLFATPGIKYSLAGPALGFASLSTAKLTLHLRRFAVQKSNVEEMEFNHVTSYRFERRRSWVGMTAFEGTDLDSGAASGEPHILVPPLVRGIPTAKNVAQMVRAGMPVRTDYRVSRKT